MTPEPGPPDRLADRLAGSYHGADRDVDGDVDPSGDRRGGRAGSGVLRALAVTFSMDVRPSRRSRSRRRAARIDAELPTVAELLALAVSAGDSVESALERLSRVLVGELAAECAVAAAGIRAGQPLERVLRDLSGRTGSTGVERLVDGILLAAEHGVPLADVLGDQARDARSARRTAMIEAAGRRDALVLGALVTPTLIAFGAILLPG